MGEVVQLFQPSLSEDGRRLGPLSGVQPSALSAQAWAAIRLPQSPRSLAGIWETRRRAMADEASRLYWSGVTGIPFQPRPLPPKPRRRPLRVK